MLLIDDTGHLRAGNAAALRLLGYPPEELAQKTIYEITHPDDRDLTRDVANRVNERREPTVAVEKRYLRKNGEIVWARVRSRRFAIRSRAFSTTSPRSSTSPS